MKLFKNQLYFIIATIACVLFVVAFTKYLGDAPFKLFTTSTSGTASLPFVTEVRLVNHATLPRQLKGKDLPFHQIYEPRKISFDGYVFTAGSFMTRVKPKTILLATPWNGVFNTINFYTLPIGNTSFLRYGCPNSNCVVTNNMSDIEEADAVIFHLLDLPGTYPTYRRPDQVWIGYIMEAPWLLSKNKVNFSPINNLFNWTMSYREDSDVMVKYGFVGRKSPSEITSNNVSKNGIPFNRKKPVVWFVSDCKVDSARGSYVKQLRKYIQVDIYGRCGKKKCFPAQSSVCYRNVLKSYKFYLSFENSICKDYVTEKYFNVLEYDVVPVVFGGANYELIGPPDGFINATNYPDPALLAKYLMELSNDQDKYSKYLGWKASYRAYLYPWMCYLCDKLHGPITPKVKFNFRDWWMKEARCKTWSFKKREFVDRTY